MGPPTQRMNVFERYLSLWVAACMGLGVVIGRAFPAVVGTVRDLQFGEGSQINIPIAILIWLMIYPMMLKIDFASIRGVSRRPTGLVVTLVVNWLVIAVPILIQVYFNSGLAYGLMRALHVPSPVAAPGALIGASNLFELAVATDRPLRAQLRRSSRDGGGGARRGL